MPAMLIAEPEAPADVAEVTAEMQPAQHGGCGKVLIAFCVRDDVAIRRHGTDSQVIFGQQIKPCSPRMLENLSLVFPWGGPRAVVAPKCGGRIACAEGGILGWGTKQNVRKKEHPSRTQDPRRLDQESASGAEVERSLERNHEVKAPTRQGHRAGVAKQQPDVVASPRPPCSADGQLPRIDVQPDESEGLTQGIERLERTAETAADIQDTHPGARGGESENAIAQSLLRGKEV